MDWYLQHRLNISDSRVLSIVDENSGFHIQIIPNLVREQQGFSGKNGTALEGSYPIIQRVAHQFQQSSF